MATSPAESNLAAAVGAIRGLVENGGEGETAKKQTDLSSCDTAELLDTVLRERLPSLSQDDNPGRQFNSIQLNSDELFGNFLAPLLSIQLTQEPFSI